jgi:hypothetical protein
LLVRTSACPLNIACICAMIRALNISHFQM